jgi:hypothetical protein
MGYRYVRKIHPTTLKPQVVGLDPDPVTVPVVERIFAEAVHTPLNQLARQITDDGIPT